MLVLRGIRTRHQHMLLAARIGSLEHICISCLREIRGTDGSAEEQERFRETASDGNFVHTVWGRSPTLATPSGAHPAGWMRQRRELVSGTSRRASQEDTAAEQGKDNREAEFIPTHVEQREPLVRDEVKNQAQGAAELAGATVAWAASGERPTATWDV